MEMDDDKKRKIAIIGGIVLVIVLVVLIIFLMSRAGKSDGMPSGLSCSKQTTSATVTWKSKDSEKATVAYGVQSSGDLPFVAEETSPPVPQQGGVFMHTVQLESLGDSSYAVAVSEYREVTAVCKGDDEATDRSKNSSFTAQSDTEPEVVMSPTIKPEPTTVVLPTAVPTKSLSAYVLLPNVDATAFYNDNSGDGILECVLNFRYKTNADGQKYSGLAAVCSSAWAEVNLSSGSN